MAYNAETELKRFTRWRTERVLEVFAAGDPDQLHGTLGLAIGSRETNLRNIVGGGYFDESQKFIVTGVDRGVWQINADYHGAWLKSVPGCPSGSFTEEFDTTSGGAFPKGRVPGLTRAAKKVRAILRYNVSYAASQGIPEPDVVLVAICGYNAGIGSAVRAYRRGDPNAATTGGDYGNDVLARQKELRKFIQARGWGA